MGNGCSCGKNSIHPRVESIPKGSKKEREGQKNDYKSTETKQATFKEGVKNSVDMKKKMMKRLFKKLKNTNFCLQSPTENR